MSNNDKVKFYKNPARNNRENFKPYVPQYQIMGVEPIERPAFVGGEEALTVSNTPTDTNNTKNRVSGIRQPYAEAVESPIGAGRGPLPNVGNNIEQTWSSVDGGVVDDLELDTEMIDNNDVVSDTALGIKNSTDPYQYLSENDLKSVLASSYLQEFLSKMEEGEYLLLLNNEVICSGPESYIEEQTTALVFGEHEAFMGVSIPIDDIMVVKKVPIKVGVFFK